MQVVQISHPKMVRLPEGHGVGSAWAESNNNL